MKQTLLLSLALISASCPAATWKPVQGNIMTRWAKDVSPEHPHPEYPRPQFVRTEWQNLNGLWDYAITPTNTPMPNRFDGQILVPFPIESALSGVKQMVGASNQLYYRRLFQLPTHWKDQRVLLHFGAVDWEAAVLVNGKEAGRHRGGYDPFSMDITDALKPQGNQELIVSVWDPSNDGPQPRGKQVKNPGGIWYTPTTGIWQTAWLEPVSPTHIDRIKVTPDFDGSAVTLEAQGVAEGSRTTLKVELLDDNQVIQQATLEITSPTPSTLADISPKITLPVPRPRPWTPDSPHLYDLRVTLLANGKQADQFTSYFGMRKISLARDDQGVLRMQLNNKTLFQFGPLDQGFWPDGLYTAPTDEALRSDIEMTKQLGFNLARKHVKVEPERWYYWCDKLGLLVWQDMPSGDKSAEWHGPSGVDGKEMQRTPQSQEIYEREWKAIIDARYNHPCIVTWVPFNEGWGQFDTVRILNWTKQYDPSRLVDGASGGNHFDTGDILDHHQYPGPGAPAQVKDRAMVLGEFGGLGLPVPEHTWQEEKNWGYRNYKSVEAVKAAYLDLAGKLRPMIGEKGLSAAIYTQTTDVEVEVNGLMTYDRAVVKLDGIAQANKKLYADAGSQKPSASSAPASNRSPNDQTRGAANYAGAVVRASDEPEAAVPLPQAARAGLYAQNRAPLTPAPFMKLPIGSIKPQGWLLHQLQLQAEGMCGHLMEISPWLDFAKSSWASADGSGNYGWEEMPYWLKGFGDLGYVLQDQRILAQTRKWIEAILKTQREDGYYGPRMLLTSLKGQPDLWPHMIVNNILQSWQEYSRDERVIPFLVNYHRWLNQQPASTFANGYWPHIRWGDNIETCYWLYNRTGEHFLLDLAQRIHQNMAAWREGVINWHNVNLAQGFREPGVFFTQSGAARDLAQAEANYQKIMSAYGQFPGGGFAGDENCRPGYTDPRQALETCGMVEFMHSFEMLEKISGDPRWADRAEDVAFNSFPAALTPDWKGLHYLTSANQVQLDRHNKAPDLENSGTMFSYSPFEVYRCCQHNVSHGWPYYAEELWLATADAGLAASLYAASEVTAKVSDGTEVKMIEETDYPFSSTIRFSLHTPRPVQFPLHLRIPRWAKTAEITVNGKKMGAKTTPSTFAVIDREWKDGDSLELTLPMDVRLDTWAKNHNSVSVNYGPLTFSLKIGERWEKYGDRNPEWPEWEVFPTTAWNYGLELNSSDPARSFEVIRKNGPLPRNPFKPDTAPLELRAQAKRIPAWQMDSLNVVGKLQPSPVKSSEPVETISLIPMGAARLRISAFPVIGSGPDAHDWTHVKEQDRQE